MKFNWGWWNFMEFHGKFRGIPWNIMIFHGIAWNFVHSWNFMKFGFDTVFQHLCVCTVSGSLLSYTLSLLMPISSQLHINLFQWFSYDRTWLFFVLVWNLYLNLYEQNSQ
jgi:hypothetical protein